ncbi:GAF domain-containing sensor histidine kinase [Natrialbaceae archaeon A-chndr2]
MHEDTYDAESARRSLYTVIRRDIPFEQKAEEAMAIAKRYLGVANGHVARIDEPANYWKTVASTDPPDGDYPVDLLLELSDSYCQYTISQERQLVIHDAREQGFDERPPFEKHGLHCYLGTTMLVGDELYGTLCFVSAEPHEEPFSQDEILFAELVARLLEHELEREQTQAKLARLDQFASIISHDIRNPLNVAQGRLDLERETRDSDNLAVVAEELDRIEELIGSVLEAARGQKAVTAESMTELSLSTMANRCWQSVQTDSCHLSVDGALEFRAESSRVRQLLENLFRNAVEHGTSGTHATEDVERDDTAPLTISVGPLEDGDGFYVEDNGDGIDPDTVERIFEPGYSTGGVGIGLGLSIVASIVAAHDWSIEVHESDTGGARFEISDVIVSPSSVTDTESL